MSENKTIEKITEALKRPIFDKSIKSSMESKLNILTSNEKINK